MKLVSIVRSPTEDKKYRAVFRTDDGQIKNTDFGLKHASDYLDHQDLARRNRYRQRHAKDLNTNDPTRAGYLSYYISWNLPTMEASIRDYKRRFNL